MALIGLEGVGKRYHFGETTITALEGIDLSIDRGEFVAIWGPSGSGKSTLCALIGLLDTPSDGRIILARTPIDNLSDDRLSEIRNQQIGFIFQHFNLIPVLSALENVMLPLQIRGESPALARRQATRKLEQLGVGDQARKRPARLSGGQQQRVAIARALVAEPAVVIADEPTANLDTDNAHRIIELMQQSNERYGTTFIFATHDQRLLERVERRVMLRDGSIAEDVHEPALGTAAARR